MCSNQVSRLEHQPQRASNSLPKYNLSDEKFTSKDREIFGPTGMIIPALHRLAQMESSHGIHFLITLVMQQALAVATAWTESRIEAEGPSTSMPNYHWFNLSLLEARSYFLANFAAAAAGTELKRRLSAAVADFSFVNLWNALWQQARELESQGRACTKHAMYRRVLERFFNLQGVDEALFKRVRFALARGWNPKYEVAASGLGSVSSLAVAEAIDFSFVVNANLGFYRREFCLHWGQYLYPDETRDLDAWLFGQKVGEEWEYVDEDEEEEEDEDADELILQDYDTSHLEAYGPEIDPRGHAECVIGAPRDQVCAVCVENFDQEEQGSDQACLKLRTCGHYFHEECIGEWINGIALNSNLCPECRGAILEERRAVRAKGR